MENVYNKDLTDIRFSYNWNNKLFCKAFTTFRIHNNKKYIIGNNYNIIFKNQFFCIAQIVNKRIITLDKINNYVSFLDTGYNVETFKDIVNKMYPTNNNINKQLFDFILLHRL